MAVYQRRHGLDDESLAAWLQMRVEDLPRLAGCPRPNPRAPDFARAARRVAAEAGCDVMRLVVLLTDPCQSPPSAGTSM